MKRTLIAIFLGLQFVTAAYAFQPFVVKDIKVDGLQRISAGTVFNYLPIKVGDRVTDDSAQEAIKALFKTGFFKDVNLRKDGDVLVVSVVERPSIASINIVGNKEFDDKKLKAAMKRVGFVEGRVFNRSVLDQVEQELKNQYFAIGKYGAEVKTTVTPLERNRVGITIDINEGERATIRQINIVGNKVFSDKQLLKHFSLKTKSFFNFFSKADRYSKEKLAGDLETLRSFYQDRGYVDFHIKSTQVSITPDKKDIYITINIEEGNQYRISSYKFGGKTLIPEKELKALVAIKPGQIFSRKNVTKSTKAIGDRLADDGYAFANVNAIPDVDKKKRTVSFTFFVDPGHRVYVRRINITGNTTTRDVVIRREMRQLEGAWYSAAAVRRSRVRLQRLGFFDDVNIETPPVPGSPDQVDVDVKVKERATGSLLFGVGYSDADGLLLQASVSQRNLFGTGKELYVNLDNSQVNRIYQVRYVDPYYTPDGISRGFSIYNDRVDATQTYTVPYVSDTTGATVSYQIPVSETNSVNLGAGFERVDLSSTTNTPPEVLSFIDAHPSSNVFKVTGNFSRDTRDSFLFPTAGSLNRIALEASVPGGDLEYYKLRYESTWFLPIGSSMVMKLGGQLGYGDGYGKTTGLPFYKNFYAGGASSVRGYKSRTLGPRDTSANPQPLGGSKLILGSAELIFPIPGMSESKDKRMSLFVDAGQVYGSNEKVDLGQLRYSAGIAFNWYSPVGPLAISFANPLNKKPGDETERVQFTLGQVFQ